MKFLKICHSSLICLSLMILFSCNIFQGPDILDTITDNEEKITISQGIAGTVIWQAGDFMPGNGPRDNVTEPALRTVKLYEYSCFEDIIYKDSSHRYFDSLSTSLIASTITNKDGFFQIAVADTGFYSIFTVENNSNEYDSTFYYVDWYDGQGGLAPIRVKQDSVTIKNIYITYMAAY